MKRSSLHRPLRGRTNAARRGSTAIEFALTLPMLVTTALAVFQLGGFLSERQRFVQAAYEVARFATLGDEYATDTAIVEYATDSVKRMGMDATSLDVGVERGYDGPDEIVTVGVALPVTSFAGLLETPLVHRQQFTVVTREDF